MSDISLAGFTIYPGILTDESYVLPVYSFKCPCDILYYLPRDTMAYLGNNYLEKIFMPKDLKKYRNKRHKTCHQLSELIHHIGINISAVSCECQFLRTEICSSVDLSNFEKKISFKSDPKLELETIINNLKNYDYLEMNAQLDRFIINYWAFSVDAWSQPSGNCNFQEIKKRIETAPEAKLSMLLNENTVLFEKEIKSILDAVIIPPLIRIINNYAYSAADVLGKILSIVQQDMLKYGQILSRDKFKL